jgi:hypothetical protein
MLVVAAISRTRYESLDFLAFYGLCILSIDCLVDHVHYFRFFIAVYCLFVDNCMRRFAAEAAVIKFHTQIAYTNFVYSHSATPDTDALEI